MSISLFSTPRSPIFFVSIFFSNHLQTNLYMKKFSLTIHLIRLTRDRGSGGGGGGGWEEDWILWSIFAITVYFLANHRHNVITANLAIFKSLLAKSFFLPPKIPKMYDPILSNSIENACNPIIVNPVLKCDPIQRNILISQLRVSPPPGQRLASDVPK